MSNIIIQTQRATLQNALESQTYLTISQAQEALLAVDDLTDEVASFVAASILNMPTTAASKVASIVGEASEADPGKNFLGALLSKFRKPSAKPKYVRVDQVQAVVKDAIEKANKPSIALSDWDTSKPDLSGW